MLVKFKKSDLNGEDVRLSPSYITNGSWAVKLECVENRAMVDTEDKLSVFAPNTRFVTLMDDEKIENCFPKEKTLKVKSDGTIFNSSYDLDPKQDIVAFKNGDGETYFKRAYVRLLGLAGMELLGDSFEGPFCDEAGNMVIMPVRK